MAIDDIISGGQRNKRDGGSRRSASRAIVFLTLAIVAGGSSAGLLKWYLDKRQAMTPVLSQIAVAAIDLPLGTTLQAEHVELAPWPKNARPPGTFTGTKELVGRVVVSRLVKGEALLAPKLASREAGGGLAALIPANMRAAAVRVNDVVGVAGFIHPEDRVDVLVTLRPENGEPEAKVILQNVKVLAVGKQLDVEEKQKSKSVPVTVATLLVTPEQSERLALAATQGKLLLTLRSWTDEEEVMTEGVVARDLLDGRAQSAPVAEASKSNSDSSSGSSRRSRSRRSERVAKAEPAPEKKDVVEILRGDRFEERKFEGKEGP